jgi:hypothetical protein
MFQKSEVQHSRRLKFQEAKPTSKQRLCTHTCDADEFKVQDAGAFENQLLKHVRYMSTLDILHHLFVVPVCVPLPLPD